MPGPSRRLRPGHGALRRTVRRTPASCGARSLEGATCFPSGQPNHRHVVQEKLDVALCNGASDTIPLSITHHDLVYWGVYLQLTEYEGRRLAGTMKLPGYSIKYKSVLDYKNM